MRFFPRALVLAALLSASLPVGVPRVSAAPTSKSVLVLLPFQPDLAVSQLALQTLQAEFAGVDDLALTVYYEYTSSNLFSSSADQQALFDLYAARYQDQPIDLVLIETETALTTWLSRRDQIAPNAPVVYFDTLSESFDSWSLPADVTGVGGVLDYLPSIEWMMRVRPAVSEVVLVHGVGPLDLVPDNIQPVNDFVLAMRDKVQITDLSPLPLPEVKRLVAALPPTAVVLYHPVFQDAAGDHYSPLTVLRELAALSPVPVMIGFDTGLGTGAIGGSMYSLERQTRQAAQLALRILRGEAVSALPLVNDQPNLFMFDHPALQRFGIALSLLPPDSTIKNRQYSPWELYRPQIIATSAGIIALLLLVVFLLGATRQLNRTRLALAQLNSSLETQVHDRTARLNQTNRLLQAEINERQQLEDELLRQATTDGLTGVANRRHFLDLLQGEINRASRLNHPLAIALIDVDCFKQVNDTYGHAAGDQALVALAQVCQQNIRDADILGRFGGDEFALLLPETSCNQAQIILERVRLALVARSIAVAGGPIRLTISVGISNLDAEPEASEKLWARADLALYQAKDAGRNQVVVVSGSG